MKVAKEATLVQPLPSTAQSPQELCLFVVALKAETTRRCRLHTVFMS